MNLSKAAIISLLNGFFVVTLILLDVLDIFKYQLIFSYQWHKLFHIVGLILFFGNMLVGPVWFIFALFSKDAVIIRFAVKLLQLTDVTLTLPGMDLVIINGLFLASVHGGIKAQPWLLYSTFFLLSMWLLSLPLLYIQEKLCHMLKEQGELSPQGKKLFLWWSFLGTFVTIPPTIILYLMIMKKF